MLAALDLLSENLAMVFIAAGVTTVSDKQSKQLGIVACYFLK